MPTGKASTRTRSGSCFPASSRRSSLGLAALFLLGASACRADGGPTAAEAAPRAAAAPARDEDAALEMRERRILGKESPAGPAQRLRLRRLREAESMGAFDLLRDKLGTLRGYAVESPRKAGVRSLWLTEEGYDKFVFLFTQESIAYFQSRGVEAKFVFQLRSSRGRRLYDGATGLLTQEGLELYGRVRRGQPVLWKQPDGTVNGNVRPPRRP